MSSVIFLRERSELYLEPSRTSTIELFCEIINGYVNGSAVNYCRKKATSHMFDGVLNAYRPLNIYLPLQ